MNTGKTIKLSPRLMQFFADEFYMFVLWGVSFLLCGYEDYLIQVCSTLASLCIGLYLLVRLAYYQTVRWEITSTQIKSVHGILRKKTNYVELYRVIDYAEEQTLFQQFVGLKDVFIISSDPTDPALRIFGIDSQIDIINEIKPLVKQNRKENHIYEIANQ